MIGLYTVVASMLSILRYESLLTQATDLGIFMQALYSTMHGRFLYEAVDYQVYGTTSFLGVHFSPILFTTVPLYAAFPYPHTLLILQALVVASGSVPTYLIAKITNSERRALGFSVFYLVYAPLLGANLYDFHVEAFLPVLLLFTFYLIQARRYLGSLIPILLSLATTEAAPPMIASVMLYFIVRDVKNCKNRRWEFFLLALMVPVYLSVRYLMSFFSASQGVAVGLNLISVSYLPSSLPSKVAYLLAVLAAAGFLPLLSPATAVMALPWIVVQFLSDHAFPHSMGWQYEFFLVPWIIVGTVYGYNATRENWLARMLKREVSLGKLLKVGLFASLILSPAIPFAAVFLKPVFSGQGYIVSYSASTQYPEITNLVKGIGPGPIWVSNHLFPYVAHNLDAYDFEPNLPTLGTLTRVPRLQYLLMQEQDIGQLPTGLLIQFSPVLMIPGNDAHENIYLYQRLPGG